MSLCGPPVSHAGQSERAARGKRIVEKPVATNPADLERVARLGVCVPVLQWRAGRALLALRAAVRTGELGGRPTVAIDLAWNRGAAYFAAGRATRAAWGCGVLLSVGIHAVDAAVFALGQRLERAALPG